MERRKALRKTIQLAGAATLTPSLVTLLQACKETPRLNWQPLFLNNDQALFISNLVDTLLPKTATPGALDMKVDIFIDLVFSKMFDEKGQAEVVAEIEKFNNTCKEKFGKVFAALDAKEKTEILKEAEKNTGKFNKSVWGTAVGKQEPVGFYRRLKSLAIWGYFSSEEIGKNVLNYDPIPGDYVGCIPLSEVGKTWSL